MHKAKIAKALKNPKTKKVLMQKAQIRKAPKNPKTKSRKTLRKKIKLMTLKKVDLIY